jgi:hypothetical protein
MACPVVLVAAREMMALQVQIHPELALLDRGLAEE